MNFPLQSSSKVPATVTQVIAQNLFLPLGALFFFSALALDATSSFASSFDSLDPPLQEQIKNGAQVPIFTDRAGSPWPEATIYQRVDSNPDEAAAVFYDFERHTKFIPGVVEAKIQAGGNGKDLVEVAYALSVPMYGKQHYTVMNKLSTEDAGKSYRIEWTFIKADSSIQNIQGNVKFEPFGTGTLMIYTNTITPSSSVPTWKFIIDRAKENIKGAAKSIVEQTNKEKIYQNDFLQQQVEKLREALK